MVLNLDLLNGPVQKYDCPLGHCIAFSESLLPLVPVYVSVNYVGDDAVQDLLERRSNVVPGLGVVMPKDLLERVLLSDLVHGHVLPGSVLRVGVAFIIRYNGFISSAVTFLLFLFTHLVAGSEEILEFLVHVLNME